MVHPFCAVLLGFIILTMSAANAGTPPKFDARLSDNAYPYPVKLFKFESQHQAMEMAYLDVRPAQAKPAGTVVLLHGKNFNAAYWQTTIAALIEQGLRVVAPDQIGFGKSTKPEAYQYSFHQLAYNTRALLQQLGIKRAAVVGHSMGGMLASRFALLYPEFTTKLVLVNPIGLEDYGAVVPYRSVEETFEHELKATSETIRAYQKANYYDGKWQPAYDQWVTPLAGWIRGDDYRLIAWNSALTYDMIMTQPVVYELPKIEVPTLLIIGTRDRTAVGKQLAPEPVRARLGRFDELGKSLERVMPNAHLVELPGVGHLPHIEAFERFIGVLRPYLVPAAPNNNYENSNDENDNDETNNTK